MGIGIYIGNMVGRSSSSYWKPRSIVSLSVLATSDTEQTIIATIVGTGYDGVSYEYSTDGVSYSEKGTAVGDTYNATGLTSGTLYFWRARLYKGSSYSGYSPIGYSENLISYSENLASILMKLLFLFHQISYEYISILQHQV